MLLSVLEILASVMRIFWFVFVEGGGSMECVCSLMSSLAFRERWSASIRFCSLRSGFVSSFRVCKLDA